MYYGFHPALGKGVAVKVLPYGLIEKDATILERFSREAQLAGQVRSNHLVQVIQISEEVGLHYSVMEFVDGLSAREYLEATQLTGTIGLPEREALSICIAATTGLVAAHECAIIHRDIKPHNIMIPWRDPLTRTELGFELAKLTDLGLARDSYPHPEHPKPEEVTAHGQAMGTLGYMAPEQIEDARQADKRSDVFSMGATLHALLSGQAPFYRQNLMQAVLATFNSPHPTLSPNRTDLSRPTLELIDRCLAKNPDARYPDAAALLAALQSC